MCGICGIALKDSAARVPLPVLRRMNQTIRHRGPDEDGYHSLGPTGLAMSRLSIIDVSGGHQLIHNEDRTVHVVYNGEIYNYVALSAALRARGHTLRTQSDTEVLAHAYEDDGDDFILRLRGMFAFALRDDANDRLLIGVDRFGIKPLYYAEVEEGLVFGSELKALLASGLVRREMDHEALAQYFTLGYIPSPSTIFCGVRKLEPGCILSWSRHQGSSVKTYWTAGDAVIADKRPVEETRHLLLAHLRDSVSAHLVSDVSVGAFLSGGIDSSTVVALMSELAPGEVKTFSIGFSDRRYDELEKARLVAKQFGTKHHELIVEPEDVDSLPRLISYFDEPFSDSSALPTYHVSKLARDAVKVALSGDGGDEIFLGYNMFRGLELARYMQLVPRPLRSLAARGPSILPTTPNAALNDYLRLVARRASDSTQPPDSAYKRKITTVGLPQILPMLDSELAGRLVRTNPYAIVDRVLVPGRERNDEHALQRFIETGLKVSLPGDMLVKVDRMSMANSLEVRVPFLDNRLVDFVETIPISQRFPRWRLKGLLKDAMVDVLPQEILQQRKRGFEVPLGAWFHGDLSTFTAEVLTDGSARGFVNRAAVTAFIDRARRGGLNLAPVLWSLLVFELWSRQQGAFA